MMFERLTQERWIGDRKRWVAFDAICLDDGIVGKAINRLAAYEDTELTPEQVASLKAENEKLKAENQKLKAKRDMAIEDIKYIDSNYWVNNFDGGLQKYIKRRSSLYG